MDPTLESSAKGTSVLGNVLLFVLSLSLTLGAAEIVLRVKNASMKNYDVEMARYSSKLKVRSPDPILGHEHVRPASATLQSVELRINEEGLRGGPVPPRNGTTGRILFLGSSVTLGWGVDEKSTVTEQLQQMFSQDGRPVQVLNAGIGNYNTVRYVRRFLTRLSELEPSDLVVHYFVNDAEKLAPGGGNLLLRHSQLALTLWIAFHRQFDTTGEQSLIDHYRKVYAPDAPGFIEMKKALALLRDYASERDVRVILAMTPDLHNLDHYELTFVHDIMRDICQEYGFTYVDLLPAFKGLRPEDIWVMKGDPHPNAKGHRIMAEALYPTLAAR